nr:hypothetical protein [Clostridia bacterium]
MNEAEKVTAEVYDSDIKLYIEDNAVVGFNLNGSTCIYIEDLLKIYGGRIEQADNGDLVVYFDEDRVWLINTRRYIETKIFEMTEDPVEVAIRDESDIERVSEIIKGIDDAVYFYAGRAEWTTDAEKGIMTLDFGYKYNRETVDYVRECAEKLCDMTIGLNDYQKVKFVHDCLIELAEYDTRTADEVKEGKRPSSTKAFDIVGVFKDNLAVCQGYTEAFYYLMRELGIECKIAEGMSFDGFGHSWNLVKLDGEWYHVDVTWDDRGGKEGLSYIHFCVTDDWIKRSREYNEKKFGVECSSMKYNWFLMNGRYIEEADTDLFYELLREAYSMGKDLEFVFADSEVMEKFIDEIIKGKVIHEWLNDMGYGEKSVWYSKNERVLWLKIFIEKPTEA